MTALLTTADLELGYGGRPVCAGIAITVGAGELVALIGANGAGKSTTLRAIAGLLTPRAGRVVFGGEDVTALAVHERTRRGIALVPEGRRVFADLTVRENLELGGFTVRRDPTKLRRRIDGAFDMFPRLRERSRQNAGTLSGGEQQMLALGRALMSEPRLLLLDEPSLGLAPRVVDDIFATIRALNAAGTAVLLVEQNARHAFATATRGYVLQTGRITLAGSSAALAADPRVREAYLGRAAVPART